MIEIQAINYNGRPPTSELRGVFGPEGGTLGRGPDNRLTLPDPARHVSRVQASIRFDGTRYLICNVSGANPLFLNEEEIEAGMERAITPGDGLRVGLFQLVVRDATNPPAVIAAKPANDPGLGAGLPGPTPGPATSGVDPLLGLGVDASGPNPFADLMGGASIPSVSPSAPTPMHAPPSAPAATPVVPRGDPFADLLPSHPSAAIQSPPPSAIQSPPPSAIQSPPPSAGPSQPLSADPFADLMQAAPVRPVTSKAPAPSGPFADLMQSAAPASAAGTGKSTFAGGIPDDFDAFALPSRAPRNSDDPLRDLAGESIGLTSIGAGEKKSSLLEFDLARRADPGDLLQGGTPSMVDSLSAVDPLDLFGGPDDGLLGKEKDPFAGSMPMRDNIPELGANFTPPRSFPEKPPVVAHPPPPLAQAAAPPPVAATPIPVPPVVKPAAAPPPVVATPMPASPMVKPAAPPLPLAKPPAPTSAAAMPVPRAKASQPTPESHSTEETVENPPSSPRKTIPQAASTAASGVPANTDALLAAFLKGARVPNLAVPNGLTPELMELMGTLVYKATAGTMELIAARSITKREVRAEVTMIVAQGNNPLKFLPTPEAAMMQMLGPKMPGFMRTADAMQDAFDDLRAHEIGVIAGMRAALSAVLKRFDPAVLEQRLGKGGLLDALVPNARESRLWNLFSERFHEILLEAEDDFQALFGQAFIKAYEEQVALDRAGRKRG